MSQTPSVGQIVHYVSHGTPVRPDGSQAFQPQCRAAIVTEVGEIEVNESNPAGDGVFRQAVGLMVANPTGIFLHALAAGGCLQDEDGHAGGTWHWPERTP